MAGATKSSRALLLLCALLYLAHLSSGNSEVMKAVNITWSSTNFKTILQWEPNPVNYFYTVEIDGDRLVRKKICIHTSATECDVTKALKDVKDVYVARIYSEVPNRDPDDFDIPPYEVSSEFIPYAQTEIGVPTIKSFEQKERTLKVEIADPLTPYRFEGNGSFRSIRDIFKDDLEYTLYYWKDQSTGKKSEKTKSNLFEISIDKEKNYCFYVQATVPSRSTNRSSQKSSVKCTSVRRDELDGLELEVILIIAAVAVGVIALIIILSVVVYKCTRSKPAATKKESVPLNA
ncbi:tissue factor [Zootoca vivipara]|uniref:tissue factor n=1 Tax=Zootoca vivipara TaxID=8524 RepID=UPI001591A8BD|nr:tissue factor isoform X1 [Zootoca vivipara]XP_060132701.1 tissue factor [Zootoca vivipara]